MKRRSRSQRALRRRPPRLTPRETVLIVCEGAKTEPGYFNSLWRDLRVRTVKVEIVGRGATPITVVDEAVKKKHENNRLANRMEAHRYDRVWCVFDVEIPHKNVSLAQALDKAKANGIRLAVSNPCFEFWVLLHFERTARLFRDCHDVVCDVRKHVRHYKKGIDLYPSLSDKTTTAIKNAQSVDRHHLPETRPAECNPSTGVHRLVQYLRQMAQKSSYP